MRIRKNLYVVDGPNDNTLRIRSRNDPAYEVLVSLLKETDPNNPNGAPAAGMEVVVDPTVPEGEVKMMAPPADGKDSGSGGAPSLHGSSVLPALIDIGATAGEKQVELGTVVAEAHAATGLTVEQWNKLRDSAREDCLQSHIDKMRACEAQSQGAPVTSVGAVGEPLELDGMTPAGSEDDSEDAKDEDSGA